MNMTASIDLTAFAPEAVAPPQSTLSPSQNYFPMSPNSRSSPTTSRHTHTLSIDSVSSDPAPGLQDSRTAHSIHLDYDDPGLAALRQNHYQNSFFSSSSSSLSNAMDMRYSTGELPTSPPSMSASSAPSLPSTGYATPLLPPDSTFFDHVHDYAQETQGNPSPFTTIEMITMSILDGMEQAIQEAREALGRGDKETFSARAQNIVTSVDLIRGIGPNTASSLASASAHSYRIDALYDSVGFSGHPPMSSSPHVHVSTLDGVSGATPESATSSPSNKVAGTSTEDQQRYQAQAFSYGLSLLDIADPSRKRTISTATARAAEPDRAPKTQKRSPSKDSFKLNRSRAPSVSVQGLELNSTPAVIATLKPPSASANSPVGFEYSQPAWTDFSGASMSRDVFTLDNGAHNLFGGPQQQLSPSNTRHHPSLTAYTPSPLATKPTVRPSRSSSYSSTHPSLSSFGHDLNIKAESSQSSASVAYSRPHSPDSFMSESEADVDLDDPTSRRGSHSVYSEHPIPPRNSRRPTMSGDVINPANLVSAELKVQMDKVFDAYLQRICSNLEAMDSKGEAIHQTLMPKKMAKMDESLDFRPFKFRIAAFTNGFMEELAQHHLGEDVIPQKKVKAYLWHQQPFISRFNEDGKKSKSKGNHVWHIFARKEPDGSGWVFRTFERKIVGNPAPIAYVGLKWAWQPRIWDPQMSRQSITVAWSSPTLPTWLSWHKDLLIGVPGPGDATDVDIVIEASFPNEDRESIRSSFHVQVAPFTISEQIMASKPRRPSVAGDPSDPRRIASDTVVPQTARSAPRASNSPPAANNVGSDPSQTLRVVTEAIHNVAQALSQAKVALHGAGNTVQMQRQVALSKQQQVLVTTAEALSVGMLDTRYSEVPPAASTLAHAARDVVNEVARQIVLERATRMSETPAASNAEMKPGAPPSHPLSIKEVAAGLQTSVAQAVNRSNAMSSELEVMMTACALIKQQGQVGITPQVPLAPPTAVAPSILSSDFELPVLLRSRSSGPMIKAIPTNAGVRLEDVIVPAPSQELSLGQIQAPPS